MNKLLRITLLINIFIAPLAAQAMQQLKSLGTCIAQSNFLKPKPLVASTAVLSAGLLWKQYDAKKQAELDQHLAHYIPSCNACCADKKITSHPRIHDKAERKLLIELMTIKKSMGLPNEVKLAFCEGSLGYGYATQSSECSQHQPHTIIGITSQAKDKPHEQKGVFAHELAHIAQNHIRQSIQLRKTLSDQAFQIALKCVNKNYSECRELYRHAIEVDIPQQLKALSRQQEYEADKIAALTLKNIDPVMKIFSATRDASSPTGWKLPPEDVISENNGSFIFGYENETNHPSHSNRCRALLALQQQNPEIFKQREELHPSLLVP